MVWNLTQNEFTVHFHDFEFYSVSRNENKIKIKKKQYHCPDSSSLYKEFWMYPFWENLPNSVSRTPPPPKRAFSGGGGPLFFFPVLGTAPRFYDPLELYGGLFFFWSMQKFCTIAPRVLCQKLTCGIFLSHFGNFLQKFQFRPQNPSKSYNKLYKGIKDLKTYFEKIGAEISAHIFGSY